MLEPSAFARFGRYCSLTENGVVCAMMQALVPFILLVALVEGRSFPSLPLK